MASDILADGLLALFSVMLPFSSVVVPLGRRAKLNDVLTADLLGTLTGLTADGLGAWSVESAEAWQGDDLSGSELFASKSVGRERLPLVLWTSFH